uniref:Triadin n=1 Tax=Nothobranchius rachovii TaxID=451742 RepID=A0A1A8PAG2_9TELE
MAEKKDAPRRVSAVRRKKEKEAVRKDEKPRREALPRIVMEPKTENTTAELQNSERHVSAGERKTRQTSTKPDKTVKPEKKSVKEAEDQDKQPETGKLQTEENITEKKKSSQKFFQCIYFPGKHAHYPLRPFTPAMSPAMLSPAVRSMLEQQRAARAPGQ